MSLILISWVSKIKALTPDPDLMNTTLGLHWDVFMVGLAIVLQKTGTLLSDIRLFYLKTKDPDPSPDQRTAKIKKSDLHCWKCGCSRR
jgi:hypothetical protein